MKKIFLFLALLFLLQKSFAQCGTTVQPSSFCGPGCFGSLNFNSTGGTPPYDLIINSAFVTTYSSTYTMFNLCAGNDTCIITDNTFSCSDTIIVTVVENPMPGISMNVTNETCAGCCDGIIALGTCSLCAYTWSNAAISWINNNLCSGVYTATVSDFEGCTSSASATVGVGNGGNCSASFMMYPTGNPHDYWVVNNSTGVLPLQYDWDWGDGSPHDFIAFPTHTYAAAGIYNISLTITDATGCTNMQLLNTYLARMEQMLTVTVVPQLPTSTMQLSEEDIFIHPNPAANELIIENGEWKIELVEVYNIMGERIYRQMSDIQRLTINVSKLTPGVYFVTVNDENKNLVTRKFIKM